MASQTKITITHDKESTVDLKNRYQATSDKPRLQAVQLETLLASLASGVRMGTLVTTIDDGDAVAASATIAFSGVGSASDTVLVNGVTFTAVASGATGNQWNVGASATLSAANLAAAIVASATALVNLHVTAAAVSGTITVTSVSKSALGNAVTLAKGVDLGPVMTVSAARLAGGTNSANSVSVSYAFGV